MSLKSLAKTGLLAAVSKLTGRHAVLLPPEAADEDSRFRLLLTELERGDLVTVVAIKE